MGNTKGKTSSGCRAARGCSSAHEAPLSCSRIFIPRIESVPRCSRSFIALATARLPMSNALPSSPSRGPCPPVRQICPCALRPIAADPVPATRTITGPSPAAASATSKSVKMLTAAPGNAPASDARIRSFISGFPVPANPAPSAATAFRATRACCKERSAAFSISPVADSTPTREGFDGPEKQRARIFPAGSIKTHSVLVPPPSKPRT